MVHTSQHHNVKSIETLLDFNSDFKLSKHVNSTDIDFLRTIGHVFLENDVPPIVLYTDGYDEDAFDVNVVFRNKVMSSNTCSLSLMNWLDKNDIAYSVGHLNNVTVHSEYFFNMIKNFYPTY